MWQDFKRFALALLLFSVLDGTVGRLLGFDRSETRNAVLAVGFAIIAAIRERRDPIDATRPEA